MIPNTTERKHGVVWKQEANHAATNVGKLCPHVFKCVNYKGDHQVDSYSCPYWHNRFNKDWHGRNNRNSFKSRV